MQNLAMLWSGFVSNSYSRSIIFCCESFTPSAILKSSSGCTVSLVRRIYAKISSKSAFA